MDDRPAQTDPPAQAPAGRSSSSASSTRAHMVEMARELTIKTELIESLSAELERAAVEIDRLQRTASEHRHGSASAADLNALRQALEECDEELTATNEQVDALRRSLAEADEDLTAKAAELESLRKSLAESEDAAKSKDALLEPLQKSLAACEAELKSSQALIGPLQKSLAKCEAELASKEALVQPLQKTLAEREAELASKEALIEPLRKAVAEYEAQLASQDTSFEPLRKALAECEAELAAKSALVESLTAQLERAAEQIDRMQRSGADRRRGPGGGGGGFPSELIEEQRQLASDMQRLVQQWEDMQAGFALGRLEMQLSELREFMAERLDYSRGSSTKVESREPPPVITEPLGHSSSRSVRSESKDSPAPASTAGLSGWELLKAQMLDMPTDGPAATKQPEHRHVEHKTVETKHTETRHEEPHPLEPRRFESIPTQLEALPEAPAAIDDSTTDPETLWQGIAERDAYIVRLLRRLRTAEEMEMPADWSELEAASPDMAAALQEMSARLQDMLRITEVEVSIERAQVARSQMQVAMQQETIAKHLKKLGINSIDELVAMGATAAGAPDRRWARFLGGNK